MIPNNESALMCALSAGAGFMIAVSCLGAEFSVMMIRAHLKFQKEANAWRAKAKEFEDDYHRFVEELEDLRARVKNHVR